MKKTKVSAIIIDDEKLAREITKGYLKNNPEVDIVAECSNGFDAIKKNKPIETGSDFSRYPDAKNQRIRNVRAVR